MNQFNSCYTEVFISFNEMNRKCTGFVWRLRGPDIRLCCFFSRWRQITLGHVDPLRWAERGHLKMSSVYNGLRGRKLPHFPDSLLFPQEGRRKETELWVGRVGNQGGLAVTPMPSPFLQPPSTHLECCKTHAAALSPSPRTSVSQSQTDFKGRNETDPRLSWLRSLDLPQLWQQQQRWHNIKSAQVFFKSAEMCWL